MGNWSYCTSVQNDIDLQGTLSYPLGPVPWLLATADGMPVKLTRQSSYTTLNPQWKHYCFVQKKMLFYCRWKRSSSIPDNFEDLADAILSLLPKFGRIDFVTDMYKPMSIKSFERRRRSSQLLSSQRTGKVSYRMTITRHSCYSCFWISGKRTDMLQLFRVDLSIMFSERRAIA